MSEERDSDEGLKQVMEYAEEQGVRVQIGPGELERLASDDVMERRRALAVVSERVVWDAFRKRRGWDE